MNGWKRLNSGVLRLVQGGKFADVFSPNQSGYIWLIMDKRTRHVVKEGFATTETAACESVDKAIAEC